MDRRKLIATAAGAFAASVTQSAQAWRGKTIDDHLADPDFRKKHFTRFIELDTESQMEFTGFFTKHLKEFGPPNSFPDQAEYLKAAGYPDGPTDKSHEECHNIMLKYAPYAANLRLARTSHEMMWDRAIRSIHKHADMYLAAMEATDKMGPGSLQLDAKMEIPDYTRHEIHEQPGGYVGSPFAGMLYHYAMITSFYHAFADHEVRRDERNQYMVAGYDTPPDGKIKRILEVGTSHGSTTIALRERFDNPDIDVYGIDIGGPQVRYAHHRAVSMGHKIHFSQQLAEKTNFPDNYFDIVAVHLLFHEVPQSIAEKIIPELQRITRPGGVWVGDAATQGGPRNNAGMLEKARTWVSHRHNMEVWTLENNRNDFPVLRKQAGWKTDRVNGKTLSMKV